MLKVIDCCGMLCPKPLIETKKALKENAVGTPIEVIIDNEISCKNVLHFLSDNGVQHSVVQNDKVFSVKIHVPESLSLPSKNVEEYCEISFPKAKAGGYIVVLDSNLMGSGSEDLGRILMKGFLSTLPELDPLPSEIICYNSAVKLAQKGTDTASTLRSLYDQGIKISLCGTCIDFFGIKDDIEVGSISNMLYIAEKLTSNLKVVKP